MAVLVFRLNRVPEDEAQAVRALLDSHGIEYFETHAGWWGVAVAGIWLPDPSRYADARALIDAYQRDRTDTARAEWAAQRQAGTADTLLRRLQRHPLTLLLYGAAILMIAYLTVMPFVRLG
jgi:hypothetical protein